MTIISMRVIKNPRKVRQCDECRRFIYGEQVRLYGSADRFERPYMVYIHRECAFTNDVKALLEKHDRQVSESSR